MIRRPAAVVLMLCLAGGLAACATPAGTSGSAPPAASPSASESDAPADVRGAWLDGGRMLGLMTYGSSTCVPSAVDTSVVGGTLEVTLADPEDAPCTRDYAPRATPVQMPEGADPSQGIQVAVSGAVTGTTSLAGITPVPGETDYLPSAGWAGSGELVILTWGSSGCPPVVQDAAATGPSEVTVTFETPPADQVCTMDMAPRATLVTVEGVEAPDGAEVVLTGAEFEAVRVPILG